MVITKIDNTKCDIFLYYSWIKLNIKCNAFRITPNIIFIIIYIIYIY